MQLHQVAKNFGNHLLRLIPSHYFGKHTVKYVHLLTALVNVSANWVKVYGTKYQLPFTLVIDKTEDDDLVFGEVIQIYVLDNSCVVFEFVLLQAEFLSHYHAYAVLLPPVIQRKNYIIKHKDLPCFHPIGLYHRNMISDNSLLRYAVTRSNIFIP